MYSPVFPCFSIRCRTANIASATPLPGMKPNCESLSLLSINLSQIFKVYQIYPHNPGCLTPLYKLIQSDYPLHRYIILLVYTLHHIDNISIPSPPKHVRTSSRIPSISVVSPFFIRDNVTLTSFLPIPCVKPSSGTPSSKTNL